MSVGMMRPRTLILHATGTNRDLEAAQACELAGSPAEIVHLNQLRRGEKKWADYQLLVLPGGFSYADALGAGKLLSLELYSYFAEEVRGFVESGKPVLGICNGFQALVKAGILPDIKVPAGASGLPNNQVNELQATLTFNDSGHFECRWVTLTPLSGKCIWTQNLEESIYCPVAHGEGKFICSAQQAANSLRANGQIALIYAKADGSPAAGTYPHNPNGSLMDIAGICNSQGNVLGLMPHPEDHIYAHQHPRWTRAERGGSGLALFQNAVRYATQL